MNPLFQHIVPLQQIVQLRLFLNRVQWSSRSPHHKMWRFVSLLLFGGGWSCLLSSIGPWLYSDLSCLWSHYIYNLYHNNYIIIHPSEITKQITHIYIFLFINKPHLIHIIYHLFYLFIFILIPSNPIMNIQ